MSVFCQGNIFFYIAFYLVFLSSQAFSVGTNPIRVPHDYISIQAAIDAATHGDKIIVSPGIYYENIHFDGKNIELTSLNPRHLHTVEQTQIDGQNKGSVVTFMGTETVDCHLYGFTITNGSAENGGGINGNASSATIKWNRIVDNYASNNGGGVYRTSNNVKYCRIFNNKAENYGGGLCNSYSVLNLIYSNEATYGGGTAFCRGRGICTIYGNTAYQDGGGTYGVSAPEGSIIYGNQALAGKGSQIYCTSEGTLPLLYKNCCVEQGGVYGPILPFNCIFEEPCFREPDKGDFHLKPNSPCIDMGIAGGIVGLYDIEGKLRNFNAIPGVWGDFGTDADIGCFEYVNYTHLDILEIALRWNTVQESDSDFSDSLDLVDDDKIDEKDLLKIIGQW
jgi:hypothetical protein